MHIQFGSGSTYEYSGIDPDTHEAFLNAKSIGSHFAKHIRPNYSGERQ